MLILTLSIEKNLTGNLQIKVTSGYAWVMHMNRALRPKLLSSAAFNVLFSSIIGPRLTKTLIEALAGMPILLLILQVKFPSSVSLILLILSTAKLFDSIFDRNLVSVGDMILELNLHSIFCKINGFAFTIHAIFNESPLVDVYTLA